MRCWTILHLNYCSVFFCGYFYVIMLSACISKRLLQRMKFLLCLAVEYIFQTRKQWLLFFPKSWNLNSAMVWESCWSLLTLISHFCVQCSKKYFKLFFLWVSISISVLFAAISFTILLCLVIFMSPVSWIHFSVLWHTRLFVQDAWSWLLSFLLVFCRFPSHSPFCLFWQISIDRQILKHSLLFIVLSSTCTFICCLDKYVNIPGQLIMVCLIKAVRALSHWRNGTYLQ